VFRDLLPEFQGSATLQIFSLLLFVSVFAGVIYLVLNMTRQHVNHMKNLPLDGKAEQPLKHGEKPHG